MLLPTPEGPSMAITRDGDRSAAPRNRLARRPRAKRGAHGAGSLAQAPHLVFGELAPGADRQARVAQRADRDAPQLLHRMADAQEHLADLARAPFGEAHHPPARVGLASAASAETRPGRSRPAARVPGIETTTLRSVAPGARRGGCTPRRGRDLAGRGECGPRSGCRAAACRATARRASPSPSPRRSSCSRIADATRAARSRRRR